MVAPLAVDSLSQFPLSSGFGVQPQLLQVVGFEGMVLYDFLDGLVDRKGVTPADVRAFNWGNDLLARYRSTAAMAVSGVIMYMHRGSIGAFFRRDDLTGSIQRLLSRASPSPSATVRDFQQPPLSQHESAPSVWRN